MNKSIFSMNRTVGERELKQTAAELTQQQSHDFVTEYNLDFWVSLSRKRKSAKQQVESLRNILKIADTDPSHRRTAEVDGTVTDLSASLHDAGFGDAGPM